MSMLLRIIRKSRRRSENDFESGSCGTVDQFNLGTGGIQHCTNDGKPHASASLVPMGGEKRIKYPAAIACVNAGSIVGNLQSLRTVRERHVCGTIKLTKVLIYIVYIRISQNIP